ncbi:MAG TPA: hypothetical protein ENO24_08880 [Chloroflexi bacterium]|nr:hypothetical protein [Chloroflexota bacterium]
MSDELELLGYDLGMTDVQPGETIPLILSWHALSDVAGVYTIAATLEHVGDTRRSTILEEPVGLTYRPGEWAASDVVLDWHDLSIPPDMPSGRYELLLQLQEGDETLGQVSLGSIDVSGRPHRFDTPEIQHPLEARIGDGVLLLGYDLSDEEVMAGDTLHLVLYWQALQEMDVSYTVFTHLLDANERIWGQMDSVPVRGEAPTTSWIPQEVLVDEYDLLVDPEAPPGNYMIKIGMYNSSTGGRLPALVDGRQEEQDRILLSTFTVAP